MARPSLQRAFVAFHLTLGGALLYASVMTVLHAASEGASHRHLLVLASVEAVGAALFLIPRLLLAGGALLLLTIGGAFVVHLVRSELRPDLLVYAMGTVFVMVHGPVTSIQRPEPPPTPA